MYEYYMHICSYNNIPIQGGGDLVNIFKALSEESRLRILALLIEREMCVCEIEASLNLTQSNASRHLSVLKNSGILESYKIAQWAYYRVDETFKNEHSELWNYLKDKLRELPTYQDDCSEYEKCRVQDLCNYNTN
jgi:ArsR family transcriptional regulator